MRLADQAGALAGVLTIVATPIGNLGDLSPRAIECLRQADVIYCEDTRHSGQLLKHAGIAAPALLSLHEHNERERISGALDRLAAGESLALISDAGTPLVCDPGALLLDAAIEAGFVVSIVPGPSAVVAAVVLSGIAGERWRFEGFLPRKTARRAELLSEIASAPHASVIYEAPHRLERTLSELVASCGQERQVALVRELTKLHEEVWRGSLKDALAHSEQVAPRGEYVIVVAADQRPPSSSAHDLGAAIDSLLAAGLSKRDAISALEVLTGVSHRAAFEAAHLPTGGAVEVERSRE